MKVSTDSIVLGSWALSLVGSGQLSISLHKSLTALDVGSGSGLLSLMLAQGACGGIRIDAVELDANASQQGRENVAASPWPDSIISHCRDIKGFTGQNEEGHCYDLIISNPPYFPSVSQSSKAYIKQTEQRKSARNQQSLSLNELLCIFGQRLRAQGNAFMTIPAIEQSRVMQLANANGLSISHCLRLKSKSEKPPYLICLALSKLSVETQYSELIIYQTSNLYSNQYRKLCANFYRDF